MIDFQCSDITFDQVYESRYSPSDDEFKKANILFLPYHCLRPEVEYCFSEYTEELLQYIRDNSSSDVIADIAITDDHYQVIELHSLIIDLGQILVKDIILPFVVSLLANFVHSKINRMHRKKEDVDIKVKIISQNETGESKSIYYHGPASGFQEVKQIASRMVGKK